MMIIIGLGTNLNNRIENLKLAIQKLDRLLLIKKSSSVYESEALLPIDHHKKWDRPFLNMALLCNADSSCNALMSSFKQVEREMGRNMEAKKWAPRVIDIDILLMDNILIKSDLLNIPHSQLLNRDFALVPAAEVGPRCVLPNTKMTLAYHLDEMKRRNKILLKNIGKL